VPSSAASDLPAGVAAADVVWDEIVPGGGYASRRLTRGSILHLTDLEGGACLQLLLHRAAAPAERLNVADTVKVQWQAYPTPGALLLSDMGRPLATIVDDTSGQHDFLCGCGSRATHDERFGVGAGGIWGAAPNPRDLLSLAAAKHGLGRVDLPPHANLFRAVRVADDGALSLEPPGPAGATVDLRAEVDLLVLVAVTPHPLADSSSYDVGPVHCTAWRQDPPAADRDPHRSTSPERQRAFENRDELLLGGDR
jgi:urea carboxylase-associated protein 2